MDDDVWLADEDRRLATLMLFIELGNAAERYLAAGGREAETSWARRTRGRFAHIRLADVRWLEVWRTVVDDLPMLRGEVEERLER